MTEVVGTISQIKVTGALAQLDVTAEIARVVLVSGPAFVSAEIGTTADNKIVITFDAAFNESYVPATSAFSTTGITGSPTITVVSVSGVTVTLTLSGDATSGDTITVGYTIPGSNPLQDADGKMSSTFAGESVTNNITVFCAEYQAVYDAYTIKPDAATAAIWNTYVRSGVADGWWAKEDVEYVYAAHTNDNGEALINWKNPGTFDAAAFNAPAFVANEGFTGNGTTQYIDCNWNPSANGVNYVLNSASMGVYIRTNVKEAKFDIGANNIGQHINATQIIARWSDDNAYIRINTATPLGGGNLDSRGMYVSARTAVNVNNLYKNKVSIANSADASVGLTSSNIYTLARNDGGSALDFNAKQLSMAFAGAGMTQTDVNNKTDAFNAAMTALGTNVF
ncbi:hypothetical protein LCGC14_1647830 [marine sediment metagenome]|uniref:Uncharacterized protein n=1 Tax=marine sediment metagenome TaxID=412755 RepID=A0A0F9IK98_9ZZZZ